MAATLLARLLPHAMAVLAVLAGLWWIDHQAAGRTRMQIEAANARWESQFRAELRGAERALAERIADIDAEVGRTQGAIEHSRAIVQPTVIREISRETRYSDPALGLSDSLREAVDRARSAVACAAAADGGIICALPAVEAAGGQ